MWREALERAGVTVETVDAAHVRLRNHGDEQVMLLKELPHPISPSQIPRPPREPALLALPRATPRAIAAAGASGWFVVTDTGALALRIGTHTVEQKSTPLAPPPMSRRPGPISWATFSVARRLLAGPAATQRELARRARVSQPKVSRVLGRLAEVALGERTADGWKPAEWDALLDWWLSTYPGPGGTSSYWYSLDDPTTQVTKAAKLLGRDAGATPVISGDVAADQLAPWRRPSSAVVYAKIGAPLGEAGFVAVSSAAEASLILCAPVDPGVWLPARWTVNSDLDLADPLQVVYDVAVGAGSDRDEAVERLRQALRGPLRARWQAAVTGSDHE